MSWVRVENYFRYYAGREAPLPSVLQPGDRVRVYRTKRGGWSRHPYEAIVETSEWHKEKRIGQYLITETHETRRKNRVTRAHYGGFTRFEVWKEDEPFQEPLQMYGPERPPFLKGEEVRYKRTQDESWTTDAVVTEVTCKEGLQEPKWMFKVFSKLGPERVEHTDVINYGSHDIEAMASKVHQLPSYNSSQ